MPDLALLNSCTDADVNNAQQALRARNQAAGATGLEAPQPPVLPPHMRHWLYGMYKQATGGDCFEDPPPLFSLIERDRWEAWAQHRGMPKQTARACYVAAVRVLLSGRTFDPALPSSPWPPYSTTSGGSVAVDTGIEPGDAGFESDGGGAGGVAAVASSRGPPSSLLAGRGSIGRVVSSRSTNDDSDDTPRPAASQHLRPSFDANEALEQSMDNAGEADGSQHGLFDQDVAHHDGGALNLAPSSIFAGWLLKKREHVMLRPWRRRWCVLVGRQLRYYESRSDAVGEPRDVIYLAPGVEVQFEGKLQPDVEASSSKPTAPLLTSAAKDLASVKSASKPAGGGSFRRLFSSATKQQPQLDATNSPVAGALLGVTDAAASSMYAQTPSRGGKTDSAQQPLLPLVSTPLNRSVSTGQPSYGSSGDGAVGGLHPVPPSVSVLSPGEPPNNAPNSSAQVSFSIRHSQSGRVYRFACTGPAEFEEREQWVTVLRAAVAGLLAEPGSGDDAASTMASQRSNAAAVAASQSGVILRKGLKVKNAKEAVLYSPPPPIVQPVAQRELEPGIGDGVGSSTSRQAAIRIDAAHGASGMASVPPAASVPSTPLKPLQLQSRLEATADSTLRPGSAASNASSVTASSAAGPTSAAVTLSGPAAAAAQSHSMAPAPGLAPPAFAAAPLPPEPFASIARRCIQQCQKHAKSTAGWKPNGSKNGVTCWVSDDGTPAARGDAFIDLPRSAIFEAISKLENRKATDSQFDKGKNVYIFDKEGCGDHTKLTHMTFFGFRPIVAQRDYLLLTHWQIEEDGTLILVSTSVEDPRCPPVQGIVRAHLHIGGWIVRPRPGIVAGNKPPRSSRASASTGSMPGFANPSIDSDGCDVTYFMSSDLKGSIPAAILNKIVAQQAGVVGVVRDTLLSWYAQGGRFGPRVLQQLRSKPLLNHGQSLQQGASVISAVPGAQSSAMVPRATEDPVRQAAAPPRQQPALTAAPAASGTAAVRPVDPTPVSGRCLGAPGATFSTVLPKPTAASNAASGAAPGSEPSNPALDALLDPAEAAVSNALLLASSTASTSMGPSIPWSVAANADPAIEEKCGLPVSSFSGQLPRLGSITATRVETTLNVSPMTLLALLNDTSVSVLIGKTCGVESCAPFQQAHSNYRVDKLATVAGSGGSSMITVSKSLRRLMKRIGLASVASRLVAAFRGKHRSDCRILHHYRLVSDYQGSPCIVIVNSTQRPVDSKADGSEGFDAISKRSGAGDSSDSADALEAWILRPMPAAAAQHVSHSASRLRSHPRCLLTHVTVSNRIDSTGSSSSSSSLLAHRSVVEKVEALQVLVQSRILSLGCSLYLPLPPAAALPAAGSAGLRLQAFAQGLRMSDSDLLFALSNWHGIPASLPEARQQLAFSSPSAPDSSMDSTLIATQARSFTFAPASVEVTVRTFVVTLQLLAVAVAGACIVCCDQLAGSALAAAILGFTLPDSVPSRVRILQLSVLLPAYVYPLPLAALGISRHIGISAWAVLAVRKVVSILLPHWGSHASFWLTIGSCAAFAAVAVLVLARMRIGGSSDGKYASLTRFFLRGQQQQVPQRQASSSTLPSLPSARRRSGTNSRPTADSTVAAAMPLHFASPSRNSRATRPGVTSITIDASNLVTMLLGVCDAAACVLPVSVPAAVAKACAVAAAMNPDALLPASSSAPESNSVGGGARRKQQAGSACASVLAAWTAPGAAVDSEDSSAAYETATPMLSSSSSPSSESPRPSQQVQQAVLIPEVGCKSITCLALIAASAAMEGRASSAASTKQPRGAPLIVVDSHDDSDDYDADEDGEAPLQARGAQVHVRVGALTAAAASASSTSGSAGASDGALKFKLEIAFAAAGPATAPDAAPSLAVVQSARSAFIRDLVSLLTEADRVRRLDSMMLIK